MSKSSDSEPVNAPIFEGIEDPREHFGGDYVAAFDEAIWRAFRILFESRRIEEATTRELMTLLGTSIDRMDKIRELAALMSLNKDGSKAKLQKHLWAQSKLQSLMKEFGLTREEALDLIKSDAPAVYDLLTNEHSEAVQ